MNRQAAQKNWTVLQSFNGNLKEALAAQQTTQLGYGSEFCPPELLEPLFSSHVLWPNMKAILSNGATFSLEPLDEELRKKDLDEALAMGNHKGAMKQTEKPPYWLQSAVRTFKKGSSKLYKEIWEAPEYLMGDEASTSSEVTTWPVMPWEEGNDSWRHECAIIRQDFMAVSVPKLHKERVDGLQSLLVRFRKLEASHAQKVFKSKKRDDIRGTATIPGYAQAHVLAEDDPVVKSTREMSRHMDSQIQKILTDLDEVQRSRL
eukprot:scaffold123562_cov41-Attheya_sp.AAC.1